MAARMVAEKLGIRWALALSRFPLPYACAIVHQGGIGTNSPSITGWSSYLNNALQLRPTGNAAQVECLGTSRTVSRKQYSASRVVKELHQLLNHPSYAASCAEIRRIVQAENGVDVACDTIEKY